jgi:hypothetical protein
VQSADSECNQGGEDDGQLEANLTVVQCGTSVLKQTTVPTGLRCHEDIGMASETILLYNGDEPHGYLLHLIPLCLGNLEVRTICKPSCRE